MNKLKTNIDQISSLTASFKDSSLEKSFLTRNILSQKKALLIIAFALLVNDSLSIVIDLSEVPDQLFASTVFELRVFVVVAELLFLFIGLVPYFIKYFEIAVKIFVFAVLGQVVGLFLAHEGYSFIAPITLVCTVFCIYLLLPFRWYTQIIFGVAFSMAGLWAISDDVKLETDIYRVMQWLVFANLVGIGVSWRRQISLRELELTKTVLEKQVELKQYALNRNRAVADILTHEIRNPLASILTRAEIIRRKDLSESAELANEIAKTVRLASILVDEWIHGDIELKPEGNITETFDLIPFAEECTSKVESTYPHVKLNPVWRGNCPAVTIEPKVLALAITNVISNASKYGRTASGELRLEIKLRLSSTHATLRIRDFGPGIAANAIEKVFEKHTRLTSNKDGQGLGLHLCRAMMRAQGGDLRLTSRKNRGAAFLLDIPLADPSKNHFSE